MAATRKSVRKSSEVPEFRAVLNEVAALLLGGYSHAHFEKAVKAFPVEARGIAPEGVPYTAWQLVEHMRRAQRHMLDFTEHYVRPSGSQSLKEPKWPRDYWTKETCPPDGQAWDRAIVEIRQDREAFRNLLLQATPTSLVRPPAPGKRKTMLRLALQVADHNAYHVGQLVLMRRILRNWKRLIPPR
jgi:DinB superfamily